MAKARKNEPAVVEIRLCCAGCGDIEIRGRVWWRRNLKGFTDDWRYRVITSHLCSWCDHLRREQDAERTRMANIARLRDQKTDKELARKILTLTGVPEDRWIEFGL